MRSQNGLILLTPKPKYSEYERLLQEVFKPGSTFSRDGLNHTVKTSGKPSPSRGECKTDLYIKTSVKNHPDSEFKVSVKKEDAKFIENKISLDTAFEIFGANAVKIIESSATSISEKFSDSILIRLQPESKTYKIVLGWKFEIFANTRRRLRTTLHLTDDQKVDIYAGSNRSVEKKHSAVNGEVIQDSGIASHVIVLSNEESEITGQNAQHFADMFQPVSQYAKTIEINAGFTALNYRSDKEKWDGNRPLAVWIDWQINNSILLPKFIYKNPLETKGNEVGERLLNSLVSLGFGRTYSTEVMIKKMLDHSVNVR